MGGGEVGQEKNKFSDEKAVNMIYRGIWLQNHGLLIFIIPSLKEHEKCVFFIFFSDFIKAFDYKKWQKTQIKQSAHNFYILFLVFYAFLKSVNGPNLLR